VGDGLGLRGSADSSAKGIGTATDGAGSRGTDGAWVGAIGGSLDLAVELGTDVAWCTRRFGSGCLGRRSSGLTRRMDTARLSWMLCLFRRLRLLRLDQELLIASLNAFMVSVNYETKSRYSVLVSVSSSERVVCVHGDDGLEEVI
jgi:hypothetical protein